MSDQPPTPPSDENQGPATGGTPPPPQPTTPQPGAPPPPPASSASPGTPPAGAVQGVQSAGLGSRLVARFVDGLLVGIVVFIVVAILPGVSVGGYVSNLLSSIAGFAYFVYFESTTGQTLLKKAMNLKVVGADGASPVSMEVAAKRNSWMLLGLIPLIGGVLGLVAVIAIMVTIATDERNRGLHDQFADSSVVQV